jgi:hypothetical protein
VCLSWLAQREGWEWINPETFGEHSKTYERVAFFVIFVLPCLLACVWGGVTAANAKPTIAGISLMFMTIFFMSVTYAFAAWRSRAWDLSVNQIGILALSVLVLFIFQMLVVFQFDYCTGKMRTDNAYFGLSMVFFIYTMAPALAQAYLDPPNPAKDLSHSFGAWGFAACLGRGPTELVYPWWPLFNVRNTWITASNPAAGPPALGGAAVPQMGEAGELEEASAVGIGAGSGGGFSAAPDPESAAAAGGPASASPASPPLGGGGRSHHVDMLAEILPTSKLEIGLTVTKLALFLLYAICVMVSVEGESKALGFTTAIAIMVLDTLTWWYRRLKIVTDTKYTVLLMLVSRFGIVLFGEEFWFIGHSALFMLHGTVMIWHICVLHLDLDDQHVGAMAEAKLLLEAKSGAEMSAFESQVLAKLQEDRCRTMAEELEEMPPLLRFFNSPHGALFVMGCFFSIDIIYVWGCKGCGTGSLSTDCDWCSIESMPIALVDEPYDQYLWGLGAMLYMLVASLLFISYWLGDTKQGMYFTGATLAFSITAGFIVFASSGSKIALGLLSCLPVMAFVLIQFYRRLEACHSNYSTYVHIW